MLGEDGIVKKTIPCEQCRKDISQYAPSSLSRRACYVGWHWIRKAMRCAFCTSWQDRSGHPNWVSTFTHGLMAALRTGHMSLEFEIQKDYIPIIGERLEIFHWYTAYLRSPIAGNICPYYVFDSCARYPNWRLLGYWRMHWRQYPQRKSNHRSWRETLDEVCQVRVSNTYLG